MCHDELFFVMEELHLLYQIMDENLQCIQVILLHDSDPPSLINLASLTQGN